MLIVALVGTICVVLVVVLIGHSVFLERYKVLEKQTVQEKMERTVNALALATHNLERVAVDWAVWDAPYSFMESGDVAFADENLTADTLTNIGVDAMAFVDNEGQVTLLANDDGRLAYGADASLALSALVTATGPELLGASAAGPLSGVAGSLRGPVLIAVHAILPSDGLGDARGVLVVARALDNEVLGSMSGLTGTEVTAHPSGDPGLSAAQPWLAAELGWDEVTLVRPLGGDLIAGFVGFRDIFGRPALVLEARDDRPEYRQAVRGVWVFGSALVALWLVAAGAAYLLVWRLGVSQNKLEASEHRYRAVLEQSSEGMILVDRGSGTIMEANQAFARLLGYAPAEMAGLALAAVFSDPEVLAAGFEKPEGRSLPARHHTRCRRKDGGGTEVEVSVSVIQQGSSELLSLAVRDITERKRSDATLRESEERYRQLFELESDAIVLVDNETGKILEVNAAATALYGYSREYWLSMNHTDVSAQPDKTRQAAVEYQTQIPLRWHKKRDGTVFPVEITGRHFDWKGRSVHIAAIRDITRRLEAEEALRRAKSNCASPRRWRR